MLLDQNVAIINENLLNYMIMEKNCVISTTQITSAKAKML